MPTTVALGAHFETFIKEQMASGRYNNASEVVREGLRLLQDQEELRRLKLDVLRSEIQRGLQSGAGQPLDMAEVKAEGRKLAALRRKASKATA